MTSTSPPPPPKLPPEQALRAAAPRPPVRGLNRTAVVLLFGALALLFGARLIVKLSGSADARGKDELDVPAYRPSDEMVERGPLQALPKDYSFLPPAPAPAEQPAAPQPPPETEPEPEPDPEELRRLEQRRREREAALDSPIRFASGETPGSREPSNVVGDGHRTGASATERDDVMTRSSNIPTQVSGRLQPPTSPYEIKAGTIIPAALVTAINSDLPGHVVGQVTTNIYDSITGDHLLVPQGARLIGRYESDVRRGQNRVLIAWQRLILPGGDSIVLDAMPGTDAGGVAGLVDRVDYHVDRIAAATLLSTLIALGGNLAVSDSPHDQQVDVVGSTVAQQASRLGQRIIDRELDLHPTITIRAGTAFNVLVHRDLVLAPFRRVRCRP